VARERLKSIHAEHHPRASLLPMAANLMKSYSSIANGLQRRCFQPALLQPKSLTTYGFI
jgi:hypothetical protein